MSVLVFFDVNETLSDPSPLTERFAAAGVPALLERVWFASVLRDGFALAVTGEFRNFSSVAESSLRSLGMSEAAVEDVMSAFDTLGVHPDVVPGIRKMAGGGHRLATLSNGSAAVTDGLLTRAGIRNSFEMLLSVDDAGVWKPGRGAYSYGLDRAGARADDAVLVAVHPWDIHGAARVGMRTAWLDREGTPYPDVFERPTWRISSMEELPAALGQPGDTFVL